VLKDLLRSWSTDESFLQISARINHNERYRTAVSGLDGSARVYFMAALAELCSRPTLVITADQPRAEKVVSDLQAFMPGQVNLLPARELFINSEVLSRSEDNRRERLKFFEWLASGSGGIYVAPSAALLSRALSPELWQSRIIELETGQRIDRQDLIAMLIERGYERTALAETGGQLSARGDIIDIYPPGLKNPFRIELFDDLVESIRFYDPETQRSTEKLAVARILPARELILSFADYGHGEKAILRNLEKALSKLRKRGDHELAARLKQQVGRHLDRLFQPDGLDILCSYFPFFYGEGSSILDYLSPAFLVLVEEPALTAEKGVALRQEFDDFRSTAIMEGDLLAPESNQLWLEADILERLTCPLVGAALFPGTGGLYKADNVHTIEAKNAPSYHGQWDLFKSDYQAWLKDGYDLYLLAGSEQRGRGLLDLVAGQSPQAEGSSPALEDVPVIRPSLLTGNLEEGFVIPGLKLAVITEQNLLPRRKRKRRLAQGEGIRLSDYRELAVGDYVVHEQHGIGKYHGLDTLEIGGVKRDYLHLKYRGTDKLYIPVDQVGLIQKYSGGEGPAPRLHSLGGGEWQRLKSKVNVSVEELARELLALYAARHTAVGYSFAPDHPWQQEFEANFPFEETPDQLRAIAEVKADLEKANPMDRLICGDVGYGKTEVAMRAAFKVVTEGKQVAVLVPTTVLAQQHYRTFGERFGGFPVRVAQLSRFVSPAKQKELIKEIAAGKIDIVIGTHRLLSKDISFHDLGLLVVDEEQRFGVKQKEKMKRLRLEVDTLAMTATPIPRTLHLSLAGARDLSIIDTPPEDRYPVQTYVLEYSESLIREAIGRELNRDGQVFLVFNRVDRIDAFAEKIQQMFPEASVAVGHGQMPELKLEKVMADFQDGKHQILISTTIIESGLDIPNVNTLIIYEADRFGLAQLYQIRGRVGRSNRVAYAYLTYRKDKMISETAQKRLRVIKEFTELGSGFKIALRDLEIRGAGNILGAEQHGFIAAVGFDLYVKLLDQAVAALKNEKVEQKINPRLELQISAYLPSSYISAQDQKVDLYQRIYNAMSLEELVELQAEMIDRYGSPPEPVGNLLSVSEIRILASVLGIESILQQQKGIALQFHRKAGFSLELLKNSYATDAVSITVSVGKNLVFNLKVKDKAASPLPALKALLAQLTALQEQGTGSSKAL
jgi:transcription-repair coupling factor (superfamily II helicase)